MPLVTLALIPVRDDLELSGDLMAFLMLVVLASTAVAGSVALNWYFTDPIHTLTISETENALALAGFLVVGGVISFLVTQAARRTTASGRASAEAEALARVAAGLLGSDDPLPLMLDRLRSTFGLDRSVVEVRDAATGEWRQESAAGLPPDPQSRRMDTLELGRSARLVLYGAPLAAADQRVLQAFVAQMSSALGQRRLRAEASAAVVTAESDALRTALLRAVSHDLRTPLSSIKASVSRLLQDDIEWPPEATEEFLETIDEETDRLNALVGNLLDMSRLETGVLEVTPVAVGWDEVVAAALSSLSEPTDRVEVQVPESLPRILADPILLERSVANLVANALRHTPRRPASAWRQGRWPTGSSCGSSTPAPGWPPSGSTRCSGRSNASVTGRTTGWASAPRWPGGSCRHWVGSSRRRRHRRRSDHGDPDAGRGVTRVLVVDDEPQIRRPCPPT